MAQCMNASFAFYTTALLRIRNYFLNTARSIPLPAKVFKN